MRKIHALLLNASVASLLVASPAFAAQPVDTSKLPQMKCIDLVFSKEMLDRHPKAPAACLEAREYQGKRYAKFRGKVVEPVKGGAMTVAFLNVAGTPLSQFTFAPPADAGVMIDGKKTPFAAMRKGETLTFWVAEGQRFHIYGEPGASISEAK
jgi:hypothetical protein